MHIIIALLGALAGLFWAFTHFVGAAREGQEAVDNFRGMFRRGKWSKEISKRLIENLNDPREATAVLLLQTASYEGVVTEVQQNHILQVMITGFETDQKTAEEFLAFARMALGEINDASNSLSKILRPVIEICSEKEKNTVLDMMQTVANLGEAENEQQAHIIMQTRNILFR